MAERAPVDEVYIEDNQEALPDRPGVHSEAGGSSCPSWSVGRLRASHRWRVEVPDQDLVDKFLPKYVPFNVLDPKAPIMWNPVTPPSHAYELRYQIDRAMEDAKPVIKEVDDEYGELMGRKYGGLFDTYMMEDAEYALLALGTAVSTARLAVDILRERGEKAGLIKLRFMRPFPGEELMKLTGDLKALGVFDRSASFNRFGPVFTEVRNALFDVGFPITDHIGGIGGRDVVMDDFLNMYDIVARSARGEKMRTVTWHGLRGEMA